MIRSINFTLFYARERRVKQEQMKEIGREKERKRERERERERETGGEPFLHPTL
jgi:hypothetical protein